MNSKKKALIFLDRKHYILPVLTVIYLLLLTYGSLYPVTTWQWPEIDNWLASFEQKTRYVPRSDFIINFLIYVPLGLLLSISLKDRFAHRYLFILILLISTIISFLLENLQMFIPSRAHSFIDFGMNVTGAFVGAVLFQLTTSKTQLGQHLRKIRYRWFIEGRFVDLGLVIVGIWLLSELSPFIPSLQVQAFYETFTLLKSSLFDLSDLGYLKVLSFCLEIFALLVIAEMILKNKAATLLSFAAFAGIVLYLKIPVVDTELTAELIYGHLAGAALYFFLGTINSETRIYLAIYALVLAYIINQLNYVPIYQTEEIRPFNWMPFNNESKRIFRITEILNITWTFLAISFFILLLHPKNKSSTWVIGCCAIFVLSFTLEWQQQGLKSANADITDVLVSLFAWSVPFFHPIIRQAYIPSAKP